MLKRLMIPLFLLGLGAGGYFLAPVIQEKLASEAPQNDDLAQTKKMLRQSFERNKELIDQLSSMDKRHVEFIRQINEKDEEAKALGGNLQKAARYETALKTEEAGKKKAETILARKIRDNQQLSRSRKNLLADREKKAVEIQKMTKEIKDLKAKVQAQAQRKVQTGFEAKTPASPQSAAAPQEITPVGETADWSPEYKLTKELEIIQKANEDLEDEVETLKRKLEVRIVPGKTLAPEETQKLLNEVQELRAAQKKDRVTFLYNLGVAYTEAKLFHQAANMYERVLKVDPNDASSHYNLGILYEEHLYQREKGLKHYETFLRLSTDKEKNRIVENWIYTSRHKVSSAARSRTETSRDAIEHLFLTDSGFEL